MKKRVLVTGSNGLLGQKLTALYAATEGIEYFATSKGENRFPLKKGYHYLPMDIENEQEVSEIMRDVRPDCVIHTAALTQVDDCETERDRCDLLNVEAVKWLCASASQWRSHFIHLSTDFIFDGKNGPYKEGDEANPLSYYGLSKLKAEEVVKSCNTSWAIVRTILVYGVVADMSRSNVVIWALNALKDQKPIQVVDDQFRMPTLAEDLAMGCRLIEKQRAEGVFHISGKDYLSIYDLVLQVAEVSGFDPKNVGRANSSNFSQPAQRPPKTGFILDKSMSVLDYKPHAFKAGVQLVMEQLQAHETNR